MNLEHWQKFYNGKKLDPPSPFAFMVADYIPHGSNILEVGAGDGRDSRLLTTRGRVLVVEPATDGLGDIVGVNQFHGNFETFVDDEPYVKYKPDFVYARWFIHAVEEEVEVMLLNYAERHGATLMLEFRAEGDAVPDDGHTRRPIDPFDLVRNLIIERGFIIKYFNVDYGLSKQGDNDPYLCRVIAEHKGR